MFKSILFVLVLSLNVFSQEFSTDVSSSLGYSFGKTIQGNYFQHSIFGSYKNFYLGYSFPEIVSREYEELFEPMNQGNLLEDSLVGFRGIHFGYIPGYVSYNDFFLKPFVAIGLGFIETEYLYSDPYGISYDKRKKYLLEDDEKEKFTTNFKIGSSFNYKFLGLVLEYNFSKRFEVGFVVNFNSEFNESLETILGKDSF